MTDHLRLIIGLLNLIGESSNDGESAYAAERLNEIMSELKTDWDGLLAARVPADLRRRVAKVLSVVDGGSVIDTRIAFQKAETMLANNRLTLASAIVIPPPTAPKQAAVEKPRLVAFPGTCSNGRGGFMFIAELHGETLELVGSKPQAHQHSRADTAEEGVLLSGFFRLRGMNWKCPLCGSAGTESFQPFWHCPTCHELHCMGTKERECQGVCGKQYERAAFVNVPNKTGLHVVELREAPERPRELLRLTAPYTRLPAPQGSQPPPSNGKWWSKS